MESCRFSRTDNMKKLQKIIKQLHGCNSKHIESVDVVETYKGAVMWAGTVEVFKVTHDTANKCYAWNFRTGDKTEYVAVLDIPPVKDAQTAVRVYIASQAK